MSGRNHLKKTRTHLDLLSPGYGGKKYLRTTKASTRMILVHVQKMYNIFRLLIGVPDYSSSESSNVRNTSIPSEHPPVMGENII